MLIAFLNSLQGGLSTLATLQSLKKCYQAVLAWSYLSYRIFRIVSFIFDDIGPAAAKEDDGDNNADDDEDRGADPNPDHRLNGQHLDKEDQV